jgi:hypothetical protein
LQASYIVSAKNGPNEKTIYLQIAHNGEVLNVKTSQDF